MFSTVFSTGVEILGKKPKRCSAARVGGQGRDCSTLEILPRGLMMFDTLREPRLVLAVPPRGTCATGSATTGSA